MGTPTPRHLHLSDGPLYLLLPIFTKGSYCPFQSSNVLPQSVFCTTLRNIFRKHKSDYFTSLLKMTQRLPITFRVEFTYFLWSTQFGPYTHPPLPSVTPTRAQPSTLGCSSSRTSSGPSLSLGTCSSLCRKHGPTARSAHGSSDLLIFPPLPKQVTHFSITLFYFLCSIFLDLKLLYLSIC